MAGGAGLVQEWQDGDRFGWIGMARQVSLRSGAERRCEVRRGWRVMVMLGAEWFGWRVMVRLGAVLCGTVMYGLVWLARLGSLWRVQEW